MQEMLAATEDLREVDFSCTAVADQGQRAADAKRQFLHDCQLLEEARLH